MWVNLDKNKEAVLQAFIADANVLYLTPRIVDESVKIRKKRRLTLSLLQQLLYII